MKNLILFLLSFLSFQIAQSQKNSVKNILSQQQSRVIDTIFRLKTLDNGMENLPVTLISGRQSGPTFTIAAGIHGMDYTTITSLLQLRREINPKMLKGNIIIIPIVNMQSFYKRTPLLYPIDNLNLNHTFPGNPTSAVNEAIADFITSRVFDATDVFLDMHGGDVNEDLIPFISYYDNTEFKQQTQLSARLSEISGFNTIVTYPHLQPYGQRAMFAFKQAVRLGIPALSIEIGKLGNCENSDVSFTKNAVYRMLAELKIYENKKVKATAPLKIKYNRQVYISSPCQGLFHSSFKAGSKVIKDEEIAYITDTFGRNVKIITAPRTGRILYKAGRLAVNEDDPLFCIGYTKKSMEK
jgi:predicted deacylase